MKFSTREIAMNGLMIAFVFLMTRLTAIPTPFGPLNVGDVAILIAAVIFGARTGFIAGAFGSALADISLGYTTYAPYTFVIKGLMGLAIALIYCRAKGKSNYVLLALAALVSEIIMVGGYFVSEAVIMNMYLPDLGVIQAYKNLMTINLPQAGICFIIGVILVSALEKANVRKLILRRA